MNPVIAEYAIKWGMAQEQMIVPNQTLARAGTWYERLEGEGAFAV